MQEILIQETIGFADELFVKPLGIKLSTAILCGWTVCAAAQTTTLSQTHELAINGQREEALRAIGRYLDESPGDTDALTQRGTILSWEGRYEEARRDLQAVLERYPLHGDALPVLINVELQSNHPEHAESLARSAAEKWPSDSTFLLFRARALRNLNRIHEALEVLDKVRSLSPDDKQAESLRNDIAESSRLWSISTSQSSEWFSDHRTTWSETGVSLSYQPIWGSVVTRISNANRFSIASRLIEIDTYPTLRPGTYLYLNAGWSPDSRLFPARKFGGEVFQRLPGGTEASGGIRHLGFASPVNVYTVSLSKYHRSWLFSTRSYITPSSEGDSVSYQFSARRYIGDGNSYVGIRGGTGGSPILNGTLNEIEVLRASSLQGEWSQRIGRHWVTALSLGFSHEARLFQESLKHYTASGSLNYRF